MGSDIKKLLIALVILFLGPSLVAGFTSLYNAITGSGLLSGSITSTTIKYVSPEVMEAKLISHGYTNTSDQVVYFTTIDNNGDHKPDQLLVRVYRIKQIPIPKTINGKTIITYKNTTTLAEAKTVDLKEVVTTTTDYDFTPVVQLIVVFILIMLLIGPLQKLGIHI